MSASYVPPTFEPVKGLQIRELNDPRIAERIRVLDGYCLAVKYGDHYYDTYVKNGLPTFNQVAYYCDILVGSITCRLEKTDDENVFRLYIMTIAVLEPYRHMGIGSRLLHTILTNVLNEDKVRISSVALHMQIGSPVINFYKKNGFEVVKTVPEYYQDLDPRDAYLMERVIQQPHLKTHKNSMPYRPTGVDRDSYISGVRTGKYGAVHDVNQRRDNLPDNVFNTIRDGVAREERLRQNDEEARARTRLELAKGKGGKRLAGGGAGDQKRAMEAMEKIHQTAARHEALAELYAAERAQWETQLGSLGLATQ